jgi:hypothetical protein
MEAEGRTRADLASLIDNRARPRFWLASGD